MSANLGGSRSSEGEVEQGRELVALACRLLAHHAIVSGILGHVSMRVDDDLMLIRCRGPRDPGLLHSTARDVRLVDLDGRPCDDRDEWSLPYELPIHLAAMRANPDIRAVVHGHPRSALLVGLAHLKPRPVFGAYNIAAMRLGFAEIPVYPRPVLITRDELAREMLAVMGDSAVCIMRGHGITVTGTSVQAATVRALDLNELLQVTVELHRLGAHPPEVGADDLAELPHLPDAFHVDRTWVALTRQIPSLAEYE